MKVLYVYHLANAREGKSYIEPHSGRHGIAAAAVGTVPAHGVLGTVHTQGNKDTDFLLVTRLNQ